jgi:hypothetical protein
MGTISCEIVPFNMVLGLGCQGSSIKSNGNWKSLVFWLQIKEIGGPNGFEGLLRYYVKLTPIQFIKQWVILELYNELLLEIFSSRVTP